MRRLRPRTGEHDREGALKPTLADHGGQRDARLLDRRRHDALRDAVGA
jgi:hypothetical protein